MRSASLSPGELAHIPEFVQKWTAIGHATEPIDRDWAEGALAGFYEFAGLSEPWVPRYMIVHRVQEAAHFGQQSEAFNEDILPGDAVFLFGHMPDAHLLFCLTYPHGGSLPRSPPAPLLAAS
jgi:hypothetical protein